MKLHLPSSVGPRPWPSERSILFVALLFLPLRGWADEDRPSSPTRENWKLLAPLQVERLDNGMTFLLYPNRRAPIFSAVLRFNVGGKDELPGSTGIAHMFEHMAFKGTRRVGTTDWKDEQAALKRVDEAAEAFDGARERLIAQGTDPRAMARELAPLRAVLQAAQKAAGRYVVKDEFDQIYQREGADDLNAMTSSDSTTYFVSLPANRIELWAKMESERLSQPVLREFYSERDVVMEERRMRNDNSPQGRLWDLAMATAFIANSYRYPVIGWESDIRNLTAPQALEFFRTHYSPERAVGALVGDLDIAAARKLLRETFGKIPRYEGPPPPRSVVPEPTQQGERRAVLRLDAQPELLMAWHKPSVPSIDDVRAQALMEALTGGRSARWFEQLVKRDRLAANVSTFTGPGDAQPNLFIVDATPAGATTLAELEQALRREAARLREQPIAKDELERARKRLVANTTRALENNLGLAMQLAESAQLSGDPWYLERRLRQLEAVTPDDLLAFAKKYLVDTNLTVGLLEPPAQSGARVAPATGASVTSGTERQR